jgi:hypothetical protein
MPLDVVADWMLEKLAQGIAMAVAEVRRFWR